MALWALEYVDGVSSAEQLRPLHPWSVREKRAVEQSFPVSDRDHVEVEDDLNTRRDRSGGGGPGKRSTGMRKDRRGPRLGRGRRLPYRAIHPVALGRCRRR